jgi:hypothetical protein
MSQVPPHDSEPEVVRHRRPNRRPKSGPALFKVDLVTLRLERVDGDKVRIVYAGWDDAKVLLAGERLERATPGYRRAGGVGDRPIEFEAMIGTKIAKQTKPPTVVALSARMRRMWAEGH